MSVSFISSIRRHVYVHQDDYSFEWWKVMIAIVPETTVLLVSVSVAMIDDGQKPKCVRPFCWRNRESIVIEQRTTLANFDFYFYSWFYRLPINNINDYFLDSNYSTLLTLLLSFVFSIYPVITILPTRIQWMLTCTGHAKWTDETYVIRRKINIKRRARDDISSSDIVTNRKFMNASWNASFFDCNIINFIHANGNVCLEVKSILY